ncbi:hypothetical protein AG1IA_02107 [Rhizoctonia solani AG-1 IA]|uniref:Uncharacterized protein n=1 Tax=Thanatephorus cucumeris (strain AG1-IA) TaxID=983506 RepID=L8X0W1_THACA|nr:hypothetical protein AG1IA_02107 [Rhizoctonia solani AG-1 IA]
MNPHDRSSVSSDNDQKVDAGPATPQLRDEPHHVPAVVPDVERNPGVARVEALHRHLGGLWRWTLYISIGALAYIYSLDQNTTSNYLPLATSSFGQHAFIGTIGTAEGIITAVGKPCIAKIADLFSRPTAYIVVREYKLNSNLDNIELTGNSIAANILPRLHSCCFCADCLRDCRRNGLVHSVSLCKQKRRGTRSTYFLLSGHTGLDLVTDIIIADITPLKWRGFATALPSAPFILNAFISAEIVTGVTNGPGWRWGFLPSWSKLFFNASKLIHRFAIIVPAVMVPAIITLFTADRRAKKNGELAFGASPNERRRIEKTDEAAVPRQPLWLQFKDVAIKMDLFGLVLIGFIFGLILFPISLAKTVRGGWSNLGVVLIPVFIVYERFFAPVAIMPKRIITNRAFLVAVVLNSPRNTREWVYFNNTMTITLCVFGLVAGLILRYTGRYKVFGTVGKFRALANKHLHSSFKLLDYAFVACMRSYLIRWFYSLIVTKYRGLGLMVAANGAIAPTVQLDLRSGPPLRRLSGRESMQHSTSHQFIIPPSSDMPDNLVKYLPGVPEATIKKLYGSIRSARTAAPAIREGVIKALRLAPCSSARLGSVSPNTVFIEGPDSKLQIAAFISLLLAFLMPNFFLGDTHNAVDGKNVAGEVTAEATVGTSNQPIGERAAAEAQQARESLVAPSAGQNGVRQRSSDKRRHHRLMEHALIFSA